MREVKPDRCHFPILEADHLYFEVDLNLQSLIELDVTRKRLCTLPLRPLHARQASEASLERVRLVVAQP